MNVRIVLDDEKCLPFKKNQWDAGYDLRSNEEDFILLPGAKFCVHTGAKISVPKRHVGLVLPRSGMGTKYEVMLANTAGVIDTGYHGEIMIWLVNRGKEELEIKKYDRFCQFLILPILLYKFNIVNEMPESTRGDAGFGASGVS